MRKISVLLMALCLSVGAMGQELNTTAEVKVGIVNAYKNIPANSEIIRLVPITAFRDIAYNDIALLNGLDKGSDFASFANVSLVDKPSIKAQFALQKVSNRSSFKHPYFSNLGIELGLKEDLSDLFENDFRQYKVAINYSGTYFISRWVRYKYSNGERERVQSLVDASVGFDNIPAAQNPFMSISLTGDTNYFHTDSQNVMREVHQTDEKARSAVYKKANWNSKKFYWLGLKVKGGFEGLNFYDATTREIDKDIKGVFELDLSFNFYHWTKENRWGGTKFIKGGLIIAYQPQDQVKQKDYITFSESPVVGNGSNEPVENSEYSTKSAYDLSSYSEVVRVAPYIEYYNFITKKKLLAIHLGVKGIFDKPAQKVDDMTADVTTTLGLLFNFQQCYGANCDEKKKGSMLNFELQVVAENMVANADKGNDFHDCLSPRFKVGIPFTGLSR